MIQTLRFVPTLGGATALWFALGLSPTLAGGDPCAAYGPGFTSVEGGSTCIHIGGRLRVEAGSGITPSSANNGWAAGGARPATLHSDGSDNRFGYAINGADFSRSRIRLPQDTLGYAGTTR